MKKILLVANRDFVLYNFRFELIEKIIETGYEAVIVLPYGPKVDLMVAAGTRFVPLDIDGRGMNPIRDMALLKSMTAIFQAEKPDMILLFTTKVCIYGGMAARKLGIPYIVNVSGLGTAVYNKSLIQPFVIGLYRYAVKDAACVLFQNELGKEFFGRHGICPNRELVVPGSGINIERWKYIEYPSEAEGIHFLFAGRIIKEKGIEDYCSCAEAIKKRHNNAFFHVAGPCENNYLKKLTELEKKGIIQYHGEVESIGVLLKTIHCLIHPSFYPEGISNVCLEASASGRPVITTDVVGCAETVENTRTGFVFKARNVDELVEKTVMFMALPHEQKCKMGLEAREKVANEFNRKIVTNTYMAEIEKIDCPDKSVRSGTIRVLHMIASLEMGGSQSMIMNIYRHIDRSRVQFDFIVDHTKYDDYRTEIEQLGGKIYVLPTFKGKNYFEVKRAWNDFFDKHPEYKILHTHSRSYASIYLPIARKHGLITISHSHSTSNGSGVKAKIKDIMQLPIRFQADYFFACSVAAGNWLFGRKVVASESFKVITNAIDVEKFRFDEKVRDQVRKELGLESSFVVGHVGRMTPPKNHRFLLECFNTYRKNNPNSKLLLVGDGPCIGDVKRAVDNAGITDNVIFIGNTNKVYEYYQAMDCFVFPSLWEGFGMAVIEAEAAGVPCVVSDVVPKEVDIGEGLIKFISLDIGADRWSREIYQVSERRDLSKEMVKAGFDITEQAIEMQKFYESIWQ